MDIQTNVDMLMQADLKDWHHYLAEQNKRELIALLKALESADNKEDVPPISLRGYALSHEDITRMAKETANELEETRKELGYKKIN